MMLSKVMHHIVARDIFHYLEMNHSGTKQAAVCLILFTVCSTGKLTDNWNEKGIQR